VSHIQAVVYMMVQHTSLKWIVVMALGILSSYNNTAVAAAPEYVPGEVLIKFHDDSIAPSTASVLSAVTRNPPSAKGVRRLRLDTGVDVDQAVRQLTDMPGVEYVQPGLRHAVGAAQYRPGSTR
jgi:hypothetical protein